MFSFLHLSLALPGAKPCGARRAERLGRSGGQGQRRPRRERHPAGDLSLDRSSSRQPPGVINRRHPLPLRPRRRLNEAGSAGCHGLFTSRLGGRWDLLPAQSVAPIFDRQPPVPPFAHHHLAFRRRVITTLGLELEEAVLIPHHPIVADRAYVLQTEDLVELGGARRLCSGRYSSSR